MYEGRVYAKALLKEYAVSFGLALHPCLLCLFWPCAFRHPNLAMSQCWTVAFNHTGTSACSQSPRPSILSELLSHVKPVLD